MDDPGDGGRFRPLVVGVLAVVAAGGIVDLVLDAPQRWLSFHVLFEVGLVSVSLGMIVYFARGWLTAERRLAGTRKALEDRRMERDHWQEQARGALDSFSAAIDRQFSAWKLTPAEREVAVLLLKGASLKRIASTTGRSERTVRQHAIAVYGKAGLSGRAELAAFFLGGVRVPGRPDDAPPPAPAYGTPDTSTTTGR
jgi:DNA-binding CsgD family transcriptional regulator